MVCTVEVSVAWDGRIVCRSGGCLILLWMRVVTSRLLCDYGILLFEQPLDPGHHRSLMMHIFLVLRFLQPAEINRSSRPALETRICAEAVLSSLCCSYALSFRVQRIDLRAHWQERPDSRFEGGSRG